MALSPIKKVLYRVALLSLFYNFAVVISVVLNLDWVLTRAAGGQYESFPAWLRIMYLGIAVGTLVIARILVSLYGEEREAKQSSVARGIGWLFVLSTIAQLISTSPDERWNAIPASLIAVAFLVAARQK